MREYVFARAIETVHIPTELNPADLLTKVLPLEPFARHSLVLLGATRVGDASSVEGGVAGRASPLEESVVAGALLRAPALPAAVGMSA